MKAISILAPWAWCIVRPDLVTPEARADAIARREIKDVENRNWRTKFRGRVLIHAGAKWGPEQREDLARLREQFPSIPFPDKFDRGGIVGAATIIDCVDQMDSPWFYGSYGFVLADAVPCTFVPCRGQLSFFDIPREVLDGVFPRTSS